MGQWTLSTRSARELAPRLTMCFLKEKVTISPFLLDWLSSFSCDVALLWPTLKFHTDIKNAPDGGVEGSGRQLLTGVSEFFQETESKTTGRSVFVVVLTGVKRQREERPSGR